MPGVEPQVPPQPRAAGPETVDIVDIVDTAAAGPAAIRGGMLRMAGFAGGLLIGLASAPLLVRHLGEADFGRYTSALVLMAIVAGLTEGGVTTIALRELALVKDTGERNRLMSDLLGLRIVLSGAGVVLGVGFAIVAGYGPSLVLGTLLVGVTVILSLVQSLLATVLQSRLRFGWAALIDLARSVVGVGVLVVLILAGAGVVPLLAATIPAAIVTLVMTAVLVRGLTTLRPAFHPSRWGPLLRETMVFAVAVAVNTLYFRVTLVIMSLVAGAAQTGYFAISYRIMEVLVGVPILLIGAAFPIVSRSARDDRVRFDYATRRMFELALFLGGLLSLGLLLSAPFVIEVLTGSSHHPSVDVLRIQAIAVLASFVAAAVGYPLLSMRRHREVLVANCVPLVLAVVLVLVLEPSLGARGASLAAVCADVALAVTSAFMLTRKGGPPLPLSALPVTAVAMVGGYAAGRLVGVHPLVEAGTGAVVFLGLLLAMGRFPPELRELLRRRTAIAS